MVSDEPTIVEEKYVVTRVSACKTTTTVTGHRTVELLVDWEWNNKPLKSTWEDFDTIYEDIPAKVKEFMQAAITANRLLENQVS